MTLNVILRQPQFKTHMSIETPTGSDPKENAGAGASLDDVLSGKEHPESQSPDPKPKPSGDGHSDKTGDNAGKKPDGQPAASAGAKGEDGKPSKYANLDEANKAYGELEKKLGEHAKELGELRTLKEEHEKVQGFLTALDKALAAKPELAEQLKAALAGSSAGEGKGKAGADKDEDDDSVEATVNRILDDRETKAKVKSGIDAWMDSHKEELEAEDGKLGHTILDTIEKDKLPFNAKTLQLVYDALTGDKKAKKAAEDALKKEEIADLDRENASAVGDGAPAPKGKIPEGGFDAFVSGIGNPNRM